MTPLPVLGVPIETKALGGQDSLYSIVQMPAGVPVGTLAIGRPGAINAALLAAAILALTDKKIAAALDRWRDKTVGRRRQAAEQRRQVMAGHDERTLTPGMIVGILGGGQLGRMLALAAAELGLSCHIYCPDPKSPAFAVAAARTVAPYEDEAALAAFAGAVDVVTFEFENVPVATVRFLAERVPVFPRQRSLEVAQDRFDEKRLMGELGIAGAGLRRRSPSSPTSTPRSPAPAGRRSSRRGASATTARARRRSAPATISSPRGDRSARRRRSSKP